jgi:SAM-dependent methyltransferase
MPTRALVVGFSLIASVAIAQEPAPKFEPRVGLPGKDVVWVPTPPELVEKMLDLAKVTSADFVIDLGSGDGRNVIAAAKRGARALGVEFNPDLVTLSRRLAGEAGVADKAQFVEGDMYEADISQATALALYLLPANLNRLAPKLLALKPGTRIVANTFGPEDWDPDVRQSIDGVSCSGWCEALLWIVPARVAGTWQGPQGTLALTQSFQMVLGTLTAQGASAPIVKARMNGEELTFIAGGLSYAARVTGDTMIGTVTSPSGAAPFRATRLQQ